MSAAPIRLVALSGLQRSEVGAWAELADRAVEPNPYLHPGFVLAAARAEQALSDVHLAIVGDSRGWECCLPVRSARQWRRLPLSGTLAWRHDQCLLGTPLVAGDARERTLVALFDGLRKAARGSFFELDWTDADGPVGDGLRQVLRGDAFVFGAFSRAAVTRRPQATYLDGRLRGKHRRSLRRLAAQLAQRLGGELALVERTHEPSAVSQFLELEAAGWKGAAGTALASDARRADFFREMARDFAARGALELLFLEAGGHVAAARCNLRAGAVVFCFKVAHDETLRSFSPGMQLELLMLERFHADTSAERMDCCADRNSELFNRLWPDRRQLTGVLLPRSGLRGVAALPVLKAGAAVMDRRRAAPEPAGGDAVEASAAANSSTGLTDR